MIPIWKNYWSTIDQNRVSFRFVADAEDGEVIYVGECMSKPGESITRILWNEICAYHIIHSELDFSEAINLMRISRTFYLQVKYGNSWYTWHYLEFQNDWSYDYNYNANRDGFSFPISLFAENRQRLLRTVLSGSYITATLHFINGATLDVVLPVQRSNDFNGDYNNDYSKSADSLPGVAMLDLAGYPNVASVTIGGLTWQITSPGCYRYAVYYINAYGGWDTLICRGNGMEADSWKRYTFRKTYDNRNEQNRGAEDYLNEQAKRWTLRTGWLDDLGASRMHHLLGSTMVFIHDLQEDLILPVGITTTDAPYKTYMNNGAKLVSYEFEVALQQERARR